MVLTAVNEGTVHFRGFTTWYRIAGELPAPDGKLPLLVVNGGPGCPHDYMEDLDELATESGRPVVYYDQLGCGRSEHADDPLLWVMNTFVEEIDALRRGLDLHRLDRLHILGHSWGSQVALEYALRRPSGLASLVLSGPLADARAYEAEARRLKESLPADIQRAIDHHEAEGTTHDPAYLLAITAFYQRWLCRLDPWPDHLVRSLQNWRQDVYDAMWGAEWNLTGILKNWSVAARLGELDLPVLLTSGRHDVTTPDVVRPLAEGIPGAEWVLFEESAHLPSMEEPERFREVVESFLERVEARA